MRCYAVYVGPYRCIGAGACGSVWTPPHQTPALAIKREDGSTSRSVMLDYDMHETARVKLRLLSNGQPHILIPYCHGLISADSEWWEEELRRFPQGFRPCRALMSERILPFGLPVRERLINLYCPEELREDIRRDPDNEDCLIRPYLGRRTVRKDRPSRFRGFKLRNLPLPVDQMEELGLDAFEYARIMAEVLARLHWDARVDAGDIEFVLAPGRRQDHANTLKSNALGDHAVWILDFDLCKRITLDEAGVDQAVRAFFLNDPYYPRPVRENAQDRDLWEAFKSHFLKYSTDILGSIGSYSRLPLLLMAKVEERGNNRTKLNQGELM